MPRDRDPDTGRFHVASANDSLGEEIPQTVRQDSFSPSVFRFPLAEDVQTTLFPAPAEGEEEEKEETNTKGSAANNNEWALKMFAARNKGVIAYSTATILRPLLMLVHWIPLITSWCLRSGSSIPARLTYLINCANRIQG